MQTIYRKRQKINRYGFTDGECYRGVHFGRRSFYVLKNNSRPCGLFVLKDILGRVAVNPDQVEAYRHLPQPSIKGDGGIQLGFNEVVLPLPNKESLTATDKLEKDKANE